MHRCSDCHENLDDVSVADLCPRCGSARRDAVVNASPLHVGVNVHAASVAVEPDLDQPWSSKWRSVVLAREQLAEAYIRIPAGGNLEVDQRVHAFVGLTNDLIDWLEDDNSRLAHVPAKAVDSHWQSDLDLRIAKALANSHKHRSVTRGADPMNARIKRTLVSDGSATVTIEYWSATVQPPRRIDALALANACVGSWRRFFAQHGIVEA
jgi:hypothetical protein